MSEPIDPELRTKALAIYESDGPAEAERQTGIKRETISSWAHRTGATVARSTRTREATIAAKASMEQRRAELADLLLDRARIEYQRLGQPTTETRVSGKGEIVQWEEKEPLAVDRRNIASTLSILVEKSQLLAGEATSRAETLTPEQAREKLAKFVPRIVEKTA